MNRILGQRMLMISGARRSASTLSSSSSTRTAIVKPTSILCTRAFSSQEEGHSEKLINIASNDDFIQHTSKSPKAIAYYTAKWCGPCRMFGPVYGQLASQYGDKISFLKVDIDQNEQVAMNAGIKVVPTFQIFEDGKKIDEIEGADTESVTAKVTELYGSS